MRAPITIEEELAGWCAWAWFVGYDARFRTHIAWAYQQLTWPMDQ